MDRFDRQFRLQPAGRLPQMACADLDAAVGIVRATVLGALVWFAIITLSLA